MVVTWLQCWCWLWWDRHGLRCFTFTCCLVTILCFLFHLPPLTLTHMGRCFTSLVAADFIFLLAASLFTFDSLQLSFLFLIRGMTCVNIFEVQYKEAPPNGPTAHFCAYCMGFLMTDATPDNPQRTNLTLTLVIKLSITDIYDHTGF